jgi:mono/diheme cytochrome c family protein
VALGNRVSDCQRRAVAGHQGASRPAERVHCTPVGTLFFVLVFVALGLTTLVVAMSRGRGGLAGLMHSQTRGSRRAATFLFFVSLLVLGALVPAWVISSEISNDDIPSAQVSGLTEEEKRGQKLFGQRCSMCHSLKAANAVAKVGPNLDEMAPNEALTLDAILKGRSQGNGQMPSELYTGQDAEDVAKFVAKSVGAEAPSGG